jgi:iron complex outermembrane receptor protein
MRALWQYSSTLDFNSMHNLISKSGALACAALTLSSHPLSADTGTPIQTLEPFLVSAGPAARAIEDFATPTTVLDTEALRRNSGATLGDQLDGQPGVSSTGFGAGASRPIIRGFDGPRVRILDSGIEALDVSNTSPDHAVALEPLLVERVEILRGPSTLLYGSSAIGGVVNVVGHEMPRSPVDPKGYEATFESSFETASDRLKTLGYASVGGDQWALSVTGLTSESEDYDIPGEAELDPDEDESSKGRLENSFVETDAYSIGGTWFFAEGSYLGLSYSRYQSLYGVPGHAHEDDHGHGHGHGHGHDEEETVSIDLERDRYDLELMLAEPLDWIEAARIRLGYTDYTHTELEGDETGTVFENEGFELRGEVAHRELGFFDEGVAGIQLSDTDFSAEGEEAFTPPATTRNQAIFASQHIHGDRLHWDFGLRLERQTIQPKGVNGDYSDISTSLAGSAIWNLTDTQTLILSLQRSQRHPSSTELYAEGPHLATEQFELGDPDLELETAYGLDLSYRYGSGAWSGGVSAFYTYFKDYIFAEATGAEEDDLPVYQFTAVDATFWGFEGELEYTDFRMDGSRLVYRLIADYVRAVNDTDNEDLPRIPPLRIGGGLRYLAGPWDAGATLRHSFQQKDTARAESETGGFTELSFDLARSFELSGEQTLTLFVRADNLLDEDIRYHTSFLKEVAPLPGRSLTIGVRGEF